MVGRCRVFGGSMEPVIPNGSRVTIEPADAEELELGDIVVAELGGSTMLHLVKAIDLAGRQVEIAGTSGPANGWAPFNNVHGICSRIDESPVPVARAKRAAESARPDLGRPTGAGRVAALPSLCRREPRRRG